MAVSYDIFISAFLEKITEYDFIKYDIETLTRTVDGYFKRACAQFNHICEYDISERNDELREIVQNIDAKDLDEIVDIISEGMIVQWLKPYAYKSENLEAVLNTSDYTSYSPAELLLRITNAYKMAQRDYRNMVVDYSYNHGDIENLHI